MYTAHIQPFPFELDLGHRHYAILTFTPENTTYIHPTHISKFDSLISFKPVSRFMKCANHKHDGIWEIYPMLHPILLLDSKYLRPIFSTLQVRIS